MTAYYNGRAERERKERDTPERILQLARQKGRFEVSMRYRDDWLMARCVKLLKQGLLKGGRRVGRVIVFFPVTEAPRENSHDIFS